MKNIERGLSLTKKEVKTNKTREIINNIFGSWDIFRCLIKEGLKNIDYDPLENRADRKCFVRSILESCLISQDDFTKISNLIPQEIKRIKEETV